MYIICIYADRLGREKNNNFTEMLKAKRPNEAHDKEGKNSENMQR